MQRFTLASFAAFAGACTLLTNLDGLTQATTGSTPDGGGDATGSSDGSSSEGGADAGVDALPKTTVFADFFDDGRPLPRDWGSKVGSRIEIVAKPDAPSRPNMLSSIMTPTQPSSAYLEKTVGTPGKTQIACSFAMKVDRFVAGQFLMPVARIEGRNAYVRLEIGEGEWKFYGQKGTLEIDSYASTALVGKLVRVSMSLASSGAVRVVVGDDILTKSFPSVDTSELSVRIGVDDDRPNQDVAMLYDDVVCPAE